MTEKVAIVGSRGFSDTSAATDYVRGLPVGTEVVSNGVRGVGAAAERAARYRGMKVTVFYANQKLYGADAGTVRDQQIVAYVDRVVAFWDGDSLGTKAVIDMARQAGKAIEIVYPVTYGYVDASVLEQAPSR